MPGGNSRHTIVMDPYPAYAQSGQGCRVTDVEGQERIDFINNYTALIRGHSDPDVTAVVSEVIHKGTAFSLPTEYDIRLAELLVDRIPAAEQLRFCNSGSEAVFPCDTGSSCSHRSFENRQIRRVLPRDL
ncbi:MAG: hypothetical protein CM1200mP18_06090 [Gammaproteobacteria bacterium]|nr:MAG: hypothetical protein CM1200mP18_06090 [Gammaproteobacteria bacterium]